MAITKQEFAVAGKVAIEANGPDELRQCLESMAKKAQATSTERFQQGSRVRFNFFRSAAPVVEKPNVADEQIIIYVNGGQRSLIVTDGKEHYFYDLIRGRAATSEVQSVLGGEDNFHDVSREESARLMAASNNVGMVGELIAENLGHNDLPKAINYAYQQIKVAQKAQHDKQFERQPLAPGGMH